MFINRSFARAFNPGGFFRRRPGTAFRRDIPRRGFIRPMTDRWFIRPITDSPRRDIPRRWFINPITDSPRRDILRRGFIRPTTDSGLGLSLRRAFRNPIGRVRNIVRRDTRRLVSLAKRDPLLRFAKRADTKVKREIARSKYAQGALYATGAILAPFTGGASLAVAAAAVQSSKAAAAGRSLGAQLLQGLGAGAIGYVAGIGLVYGVNATGIGQGAAGASSAAAGGYGTVAGAAGAPIAGAGTAMGGGFLATFGQSALTGMLLLKAIKGGGKAGAVDAALVSAGIDPKYLPAVNSLLPSGWTSGPQPAPDSGGGGGGGGGPAPYENPTPPTLPDNSIGIILNQYWPYAVAGLGALLALSIARRRRHRKG